MSIISTTKELIDLAKKGATVELELRLVRMQEKELELREELVQLKSERAEADKQKAVEKELELREGVYFREGKPYCQLCWDSEKQLINLQSKDAQRFDEYGNAYDSYTYFLCLKCKCTYGN
jgi:hypothetical protein